MSIDDEIQAKVTAIYRQVVGEAGPDGIHVTAAMNIATERLKVELTPAELEHIAARHARGLLNDKHQEVVEEQAFHDTEFSGGLMVGVSQFLIGEEEQALIYLHALESRDMVGLTSAQALALAMTLIELTDRDDMDPVKIAELHHALNMLTLRHELDEGDRD